jgi:hypothetical protein
MTRMTWPRLERTIRMTAMVAALLVVDGDVGRAEDDECATPE